MTATAPPATYALSRFLQLELPPPAWLVENLIPSHGLIAMASAPKVGKSMLAMHLARALASADGFLGRSVPAPARTLYVAEEGSAADIQRRFARLEMSGRFSPCAVEPILAIHPQLAVDSPDGLARFDALLAATRPALVVIDCLVWIHSQSENRSEDMVNLMARLRRLSRDHECAVLFIHHTAKASEDRTGYSMRGSGILASATEANLTLIRNRNALRLHVELRDGERDSLKLEWDATSGQFGLAAAQQPSRESSAKLDVLRYLAGVPEATVNQMAAALGTSDTTVRSRLREAVENGQVVGMRTDRGRERAYRLRAA